MLFQYKANFTAKTNATIEKWRRGDESKQAYLRLHASYNTKFKKMQKITYKIALCLDIDTTTCTYYCDSVNFIIKNNTFYTIHDLASRANKKIIRVRNKNFTSILPHFLIVINLNIVIYDYLETEKNCFMRRRSYHIIYFKDRRNRATIDQAGKVIVRRKATLAVMAYDTSDYFVIRYHSGSYNETLFSGNKRQVLST